MGPPAGGSSEEDELESKGESRSCQRTGRTRTGRRTCGTAARSPAAGCSAWAPQPRGLSGPRCWCPRPGEAPSARPSPTRSARSSRCRAPPPPVARPRWWAPRWPSTGSTSRAINGRPVELVVGDYESKPDVGRRKAEKLVVEDKIDVHEGGYLSNVCLACMPVWDEHKILNMIGVCLDTTITTSKCSRYTFRPFDYAPSQAVAFAPYLVTKLAKKWHIVYLDYAWGQSTRDAYAEQIKKQGGEVVGTTGIPLGTADMTAFISKITGSFDGLFAI